MKTAPRTTTTDAPAADLATRFGYEHSGFFVLRTPLLPFDVLEEWSAGLTAPGTHQQKDKLARERQALDKAVKDDRKCLQQRLLKILSIPRVREAVQVASPDMDRAVEDWQQEPELPPSHRTEESVVRYLSRMTYRCTPFGLFAGCSEGTLGGETHLVLSPVEGYRRHVRLDMNFLCSMSRVASSDPNMRDELIYRPNPSLYGLGNRYRYTESRISGKIHSHHLVAVGKTPYLEALLQEAAPGINLNTLRSFLIQKTGESREAVDQYLGGLLDAQILVSEFQPQLTGEEPLRNLAARSGTHKTTADLGEKLSEVHSLLEQLEAAPLGTTRHAYDTIKEKLAHLPGQMMPSKLFQTDLMKPVEKANLGDDVIESLCRGISILHLMSPQTGANHLFRTFIAEFIKRYESAEIPLTEVLDEEVGIGFSRSGAPGTEPSPLLKEVVFASGTADKTDWGMREKILLQLLLDAGDTGKQEVQLTGATMAPMRNRPVLPLPDAFSTMAVLSAESTQALNQGDYKLLLAGCSGPSGANMLGRFCHGNPSLTKLVKRHIQSEEALHPEVVFAEVVYLPEERIGNILLRPLLRKYDIPFLGASGQPEENQIPLSDLTVSIKQGRIILRSKRLNKRIIPRLTTAHAYFSTRNPGLYRFLCCLQWQATVSALSWSWAPFDSAAFLPRVTFENLVLSRAQWCINNAEIQPALRAKAGQRFHAVQKLRQQRNLPRRFVLADSDNELLVDLDNVLSTDAFLAVVKKRPQFTVKEQFPDPDHLPTTGPEGRFTSEIIVPFVRTASPKSDGGKKPSLRLANLSETSIQRTFTPGDEWLYTKLYTGISIADHLLAEKIGPLADRLETDGLIDGWFFIRYSDPDWHLRLRFHGRPDILHEKVLPALRSTIAPWLDSRQIWRMQMDSYQREVERYGGPSGIELAEKLFHADSKAVVSILNSLKAEDLSDARWRLTLKGMDRFMDDLGLTTHQRCELMQATSNGFAAEFYFKNTPLRHQIGTKYRQERKDLDLLLDPSRCQNHPLSAYFHIWKERSKQWAPSIESLKKLDAEGRLNDSLDSIATSYLHMTANRLLRASARAQELLIYSFLYRLYDSRLAREKRQEQAR